MPSGKLSSAASISSMRSIITPLTPYIGAGSSDFIPNQSSGGKTLNFLEETAPGEEQNARGSTIAVVEEGRS